MSATDVIGARPDTGIETPEVVGFEPETPFLQDGAARAGVSTQSETERPGWRAAFESESPFLAEYEDDPLGADARAELYASVLGELYDEEFEEAVADLVHEAGGLAEERFAFESEDPLQERMEAERVLREYFEPLARECEAMVDRTLQGIGEADVGTLSETELDAFLDRFAPEPRGLPPAFERFGGGFFKKLKKAVKGAVKIAKKGVALAKKLSPVHLILGRLKKLVRPLLERVLKFAINKLPVALRPVARRLAKRLLGVSAEAELELEAESETEDGEPATEDPAMIAQELDARLAGYMLEGEAFERQAEVEFLAAEEETGGADPLRELEHRRATFAQDITTLEDGEDPTPVVEQFVPAILAALKIGIKVIGRPRVVKFLAGLLAKLIGKYVGRQQAIPLSRALVDTGMSLVGLEAPEDSTQETGYSLASTLEDTVARVAQEAPATAWESEALLEAYVREAFQKAASAHFPDALIKPSLHESVQSSGAWVMLPQGTRRKHYKKYTRVMDLTLTPQAAVTLKGFGGIPLKTILRDRLGVTLDRPVPARVHLYESVAGSSLPDIAMHEKSVRGLGSTQREAWSLIQPLTPESAGILLREPGLGRPVDPKFLADPQHITVGQRFYYLELRDGRPQHAGRARASQTSVALDFPKSELRVFQYYSETDAQTIAGLFRGKGNAGAVLAALKAGLETRLAAMFAGTPTRSVRVVHEAVPLEQFRSPVIGAAFKVVGRPLAGLLLRWVLESLKRELEQRGADFGARFARAAADDADGVTVAILFRHPSFFPALRAVFSPRRSGLPPLVVVRGAMRQHAVGEYTVSIQAGFVRG